MEQFLLTKICRRDVQQKVLRRSPLMRFVEGLKD